MAEPNNRARRNRQSRERTRDDRRRERANAAVAHTAEMHDRLGAEIERSVRETRFYDEIPAAPAGRETSVPSVSVVDADSVSAVLELGRGRADM